MFLRAHKSGNHTYLRLVESYRPHGQPHQRVVAHLGRQDLLAPPIWTRSCACCRPTNRRPAGWPASKSQRRKPGAGGRSAPPATCSTSWRWDGSDALSATRRHGQPLSERVFVRLANRLTRPGSEHALARWLEDLYVVTAGGNRWQPQ